MAWQDNALCQEIGPDVFFSDDDREDMNIPRISYKDAKRVCASCPVRSECLESALQHESGLSDSWRFGVWGGMGPTERAALDSELAA